MNNKIEKQLNFTCSHCFSTFQLLEIHEKDRGFGEIRKKESRAAI